MITFVIPSIGRESLNKTILSLIEQSNQEWRAIVGLDGLKLEEVESGNLYDNRIEIIELEKSGKIGKKHGVGGEVRNKIIQRITEGIIAFVDDDDTLDKHYVEKIYKYFEDQRVDCLVIRAIHPNGFVMPPVGTKQLRLGNVGISFAANRRFLLKHDLFFEPSEAEDFDLLKRISLKGKIKLSDYIGYRINH